MLTKKNLERLVKNCEYSPENKGGKTMNTYRFETTATMKPHNNKKWWIDPDIVRPVEIRAETVREAMMIFRECVETRDYITISKKRDQ